MNAHPDHDDGNPDDCSPGDRPPDDVPPALPDMVLSSRYGYTVRFSSLFVSDIHALLIDATSVSVRVAARCIYLRLT